MAKGMLVLVMVALAGCASSPPKPVSCDGSAKRPINQPKQQKVAVNPASYLNCA